MIEQLPDSWKHHLNGEFPKKYFKELNDFVTQSYANTTCFPPYKALFSAFEHCTFEQTKVVIIGQDPYHGFGQAHGLCFSVNDGIAFPPSLVNIFKEIQTDLGQPIPLSGNLERWAKQGVLLLNATLSVQEGMAGSHQKKGWETFTDAVIAQLSEKKEQVVFLLWGGYAKTKGQSINKAKHLVLESGHPSPLSANKGHWFGNKHFSKTNEYLKSKGLAAIQW